MGMLLNDEASSSHGPTNCAPAVVVTCLWEHHCKTFLPADPLPGCPETQAAMRLGALTKVAWLLYSTLSEPWPRLTPEARPQPNSLQSGRSSPRS
jgi:hypothetical protein